MGSMPSINKIIFIMNSMYKGLVHGLKERTIMADLYLIFLKKKKTNLEIVFADRS